MNDTASPPPARPAAARGSRLALALAVLALLVSAAHWLNTPDRRDLERARSEDQARTQRRLNSLEDRIQREREELARLTARLGVDAAGEDTLAGRIARIENAMAQLPGSADARFLWRLEQAEYFLRQANAQENLAGDSAGALSALQLADEQLRDAADPRVGPVRKLLAGEMSALRALPRVDTEGMALKLATIGAALPGLPRRQGAPAQFNPEPAPPPSGLAGLERAVQVLKSAFMTIVSVRRTDAPTATLLTSEAAELLNQSLALELQLARLALLRGDARSFRSSVTAARSGLEKYFDVGAPGVAGAIATLGDLAAVPMPESLPDLSASLAELLKIKEREKRS